MSPPLLGAVEEEGQSSVTIQASTASTCSLLKNGSGLKEHNYMGLSDCSSSVDSSAISTASDENRSCLNLKATELRLGLPGSLSPQRDSDCNLDEKPLFPLHPLRDANSSNSSTQKIIIAGNKRGFSVAMEGKFIAKSDADVILSPRPASNLALKSGPLKENPVAQPAKMKEVVSSTAVLERSPATNDAKTKHMATTTNSSAPAPKAQVVGWPPIRSFRKNSLATSSKNAGEVDGKARPGALFVKVSMDGAPYLRKVDLKAYCAYQELSSALEKMFSCFTIGHCTSGTGGKDLSCEIKMKDLLHESEYVLTYEDKDGDWMLVGDVPWEMFIDTCKRLRIMKSSDAIGLAPRAVEKCMSKN